MSETTKLKITSITPVAIGSGVDFSPYTDYVVDNRQIYFIDKKKTVEKIAQKGDNYFDQYVYGVANMDNTRSTFDLKSFLLNNKIVRNIEEVVSSSCPLIGNANSKLPIRGAIKSPLQEPYFPGSSIKGALKTILMYNWLKTNRKADEMIEKVINDGNFNFLEKEFEFKEDDFTKSIIRKNTIQQLTDSRMMPKDRKIVVDCYRKMPVRIECIAKNQTTEFQLTLENYKWEDLAEQANDYAFDCLDRELDLVENNSNLSDYRDNNIDIQDLANEELGKNNSTTAYLRVGYGRGYYLNSLGIAIYDYVSQEGKENLYDKFKEFINRQYARKDKYGKKQEIDLEDFPKTRLYITNTQEPLGWVKIEKIK